MPSHDLTRFPIKSAIQIYRNYISYSNPLPPWSSMNGRVSDIATRVKNKILSYLDENAPVTEPFRLTLPHKPGSWKEWIIPSTSDQMILQSCVSAMAPDLQKRMVTPDRVFSYRFLKDDPRFFQDPLETWIAFQAETHKRLESNKFILQLDLKEAFASIDRPAFFRYLRETPELEFSSNLLLKLITGWDRQGKGIPLVNDSLFFLGNKYLGKLDPILDRYSTNFIRFVDDYRVFGNSKPELEKVLENFARDLSNKGFSLNDRKIRLGSNSHYFKAVKAIERSTTGNEYFGPRRFIDIVGPEQLFDLIRLAVGNPEKYLTVRFGRLLIGELRKIRACEETNPDVYNKFVLLVMESTTLRQNIVGLLNRFCDNKNEAWRLIWLLYLLEDILRKQSASSVERSAIQNLMEKENVPVVVRLWVLKVSRGANSSIGNDELTLLDLNYAQTGNQLYGGDHVN